MKNQLKIKCSIGILSSVVLLLTACGNGADATAADESGNMETPVKLTTISQGDLVSYVNLNATSVYLEKSYIKASISGYLQGNTAKVGDVVSNGQVLFSLVTKEARAIGNSVNQLDPGFKFSGLSKIRAAQNGFISSVSHQKGDYVQEGEALAVLSNKNSLVFLLDLPYEMRKILGGNQTVTVSLPDGEELKGSVGRALSSVDSLAQTQRFIIHVSAGHDIPENLVAGIRLVNTSSPKAITLPKSAVLSNETEDEFWVMKMQNDSVAVKVTVKKGLDDGKKIEILSPSFSAKDRFILTGNYGLADTAKVKIIR